MLCLRGIGSFHPPGLSCAADLHRAPLIHNVRELPARLGGIVEARLARLGVPAHIIEAETAAMATAVIEPTLDRSIVGIMVEFARALPYHPAVGQVDEASLSSIEDWLAETPCHAGRGDTEVVFPDRRTPELLRQKWAG